MSTFKKLLALTLALAMVLSVSAFAGYSADTYADSADIDPDCEEAVELMYALDIMVGDGTNFNPKSTVTRAEVAKMIYVILNYGDDDEAVSYKGGKFFTDVVAGAWYEGYVNYAAATKLVQGRPDGTFGPMDSVTCAEAAKMLLTAIGYSAEARGYVGAKWADNVLSDAAIIGLLSGYKSNVNTYAPRQWVAVMFENALSALTYKTMAPNFSGLLTSGKEDGVVTVGNKYYGLSEFEAVAIATENASIDTYEWTTEDEDGNEEDHEKSFASDYVLFSNGKEIKGTGLGAMDLGQTYRVIHDGKTAYSVRSLYETAEARILDIEADVVYGTSSNKANNKYEFTVDGVTAKFAAKEINVLYTDTEKYADTEKSRTGADTIKVTDFYDLIDDAEKTNDQYKIILNEDGEIAYMIVTEYAYGIVNKDGSHNKYGDYIVVDKDATSDTNLLTFNGKSNLYLEDCIIYEDEIEEDNIVKYTWDLDEGKFAMEVLPVVEDVVYEARDNKAKIYTIGGEEYYVAKKFLKTDNHNVQDWLDDKDNLDEEICLVVDGDMIVYHWFSDSNIDNMDDINAKLVVVIDVDGEYSTDSLHEKEYIEYMTIDGETHIAEYQNKSTTVSDTDPTLKYVQFDELADENTGLALKKTMTEADLEGRLFIIHEGTKGRVYLEKLSTYVDADNNAEVNEQLDASTSLLNLYEEKEDVELDATGSAVKFDGDTMAADNTFFYAYINSDDEAVFGVITPAEFGDGEDEEAYGQILSYEKRPSLRTTVLGGYIVADLESDSDSDYLYITKIGKETADGIELTVQVIGADEEQTIYVDDDQTFYTDLIYSYTYATMDDEWTLELVDAYDKEIDGTNYDAGFWKERVVSWYDEEYYEIKLEAKKDANDKKLDVSDDDDVDHIVITTIEYVRDESQSDSNDLNYLNGEEFEEYDRTLEVVAYDELAEEDIANDTTDSYVQTGYWYYSADADMLYVVVVRDMTQAQDAE